jgi:hypothetical protein
LIDGRVQYDGIGAPGGRRWGAVECLPKDILERQAVVVDLIRYGADADGKEDTVEQKEDESLQLEDCYDFVQLQLSTHPDAA